MRSYIESDVLHGLVCEACSRAILVAAICHGVLLAARTVDPVTGRSVLYGRKTTALTWELERGAWRIARLTRFWDPDYYRTYVERPGDPAGYMSVRAEVTRALQSPDDFRDVAVGSHELATDDVGDDAGLRVECAACIRRRRPLRVGPPAGRQVYVRGNRVRETARLVRRSGGGRRDSAVDRDDRPGEVGARAAGEEHGDAGHVVVASDAAKR